MGKYVLKVSIRKKYKFLGVETRLLQKIVARVHVKAKLDGFTLFKDT